MRFILLLALTVVAVAPLDAAPKAKARAAKPLHMISNSFSIDRFGLKSMPKGAVLKQSELNHPDCTPAKLEDCYVTASNGVELYFSPYDGLNSKSIEISRDYLGAVRALNIGAARSQADVTAAIASFVPGLNFACQNFQQVDGSIDKKLHCFAPIPKQFGAKAMSIEEGAPSVELQFDENDRIIFAAVRLTSYID